ncbi:MAG: chromate transporter [Bdellovibrionota bacterium]
MIREIFKVFLKLGLLGFGGPAAHIAMMRDEVVVKRKWLSEAEFLDLVGASNLIPGPNSTELAIHIGHRMGGWKGLLTAGVSFIFPAFVSVLTLAVYYEKFGSLPELTSILTGIRPVVTAIIAIALIQFRKNAVPGYWQLLLAICAGVASFFIPETFAILLSGILALTWRGKKFSVSPELFFIFLKIGSVLFGSGYVLLSFLKEEFVLQRGWLTEIQLLDAVSIGQFTPGPVFTTATFIGYVIDGYSGAVLATLGIFLPSFVFVALSAPYISKLRSSENLSRFLDGVIAGSFALMVLVTFSLGKSGFVDWKTSLVGIISFLILLRFPKFNSAWLVILGGSIGYIFF